MTERRTCSRAGCRVDAVVAIHWRNPRIHTGDRTKVWLACADHVEYLQGFLEARGFPVEARSFTTESVRTGSVEAPPLDPIR